MPKLLALEWDAREARVAVAQTRGKEIALEEAFAVDLTTPTGQLEDGDVGERIAAALAAHQVGRAEALVALGRANIELRQMTVPPAPPDELPEMVRFQALRQFTAISADWPLDYVPLHSGEDDNVHVLAAAISPELVEQIRTSCQASELVPKRLVLRPFAAASLLCRHDRGTRQPPRLMVDILTDEADLTVLVDEQVVLMRTVRLPAGDRTASGDDSVGTVQSKSLIGQIRRTIAAAQNQMGGRRVEQIVVCGDGSDQETLRAHLQSELPYDVEMFDPFEQVQKRKDLQRPEHAGRFTPLIGMLQDEAAGSAHALDFLHPRKKPEPPSRGRLHALIGTAAATLCVAAVVLVWLQFSAKKEKIAALTRRSAELVKEVEQANGQIADFDRIKAFRDSDYVWLDELYKLCDTLPQAEDLLVSRLSVGTRTPQGGQIDISGFTDETSAIGRIDDALRSEGRQVVSASSGRDLRRTDYQWAFKKMVVLKPHSELVPADAADESTNEEGE